MYETSPLFASAAAAEAAPRIDTPSARNTETEAQPADIFSRAVVLQLQFRRLGTSRKVTTDLIAVTTETPDEKTDKNLLSATKRILEAPELKAIEQHDRGTAAFVESRKAGPAFANQGGFHLIPLALKDQVETYIDDRLLERDLLVERFLTVLDTRIVETQRRLGTLAVGVRYPTRTEAREAFGITRRYMTFGYENAAEAESWRAEALSECQAALRTAFADVVSHLAERLTPGPGGKPKTFRDSLVANFDEFIKGFQDRNLADDRELARLVAEARAIMRGVTAGDLRTQGGLRRAVAASVEQINQAVSKLVIDRPSRQYGAE